MHPFFLKQNLRTICAKAALITEKTPRYKCANAKNKSEIISKIKPKALDLVK